MTYNARTQCIVVPLVLLFAANFAFPYIFKQYVYNVTSMRSIRYAFAFQCCVMSYIYLNTKTWKSVPFHDLITQPEPNGKYLRTILKSNFPNIWAEISSELHKLGYNFKEMNEYSAKEVMPDITYKWDDSRY